VFHVSWALTLIITATLVLGLVNLQWLRETMTNASEEFLIDQTDSQMKDYGEMLVTQGETILATSTEYINFISTIIHRDLETNGTLGEIKYRLYRYDEIPESMMTLDL
jgi:hypothetical protein